MFPSYLAEPPRTLADIPEGGSGYTNWTEVDVDVTDLSSYVPASTKQVLPLAPIISIREEIVPTPLGMATALGTETDRKSRELEELQKHRKFTGSEPPNTKGTPEQSEARRAQRAHAKERFAERRPEMSCSVHWGT